MIVEAFESYPRNEKRVEVVITPARPTQTTWASFSHEQAKDLAAQLLALIGETELASQVQGLGKLTSFDLDCWHCYEAAEESGQLKPDQFPIMWVCPQCGNKRCPRATHHDNACTGSNEPGQEGSRYGDPKAGK